MITRTHTVELSCDFCKSLLVTADGGDSDEEVRAFVERKGARSTGGRDACSRCAWMLTPGVPSGSPPSNPRV